MLGTTIHKPQLLPPHHCIYWTKSQDPIPISLRSTLTTKQPKSKETHFMQFLPLIPTTKHSKTHNQQKKWSSTNLGPAKQDSEQRNSIRKKSTYLNRKQQYLFQIAHPYKSESKIVLIRTKSEQKCWKKQITQNPKSHSTFYL